MSINLNIRNLSFKKSIVRISIALLFTVVVLLGGLQICIHITQKRMQTYADNEEERNWEFVKNVTSAAFLSSKYCINSFLTAISDAETYADPVTGKLQYKNTITQNTLNQLTVNNLYDKLKSFTNYNYEYYSAILILEPNVWKNAPQGIAAAIYGNNKDPQNLLSSYDIINSELYTQVKNKRESITRAASIKHNDSLWMFTIAVPLFNEQGDVIGEFWVDVDALYYTQLLKQYQKSKQNMAAIISEDCRIISCTNVEFNGKMLQDAAANICVNDFPHDWYNEVQKRVLQNENSYFRNKIQGETFVTYIFQLKDIPYNVIVVKPEKAIYEGVQHFIWSFIIIMLICLLLITVSLTYIFLIFKKKNDENHKMSNELRMSAEIQKRILPNNQQFGVNQNFNIYGFQRQAKLVGGDLYDFAIKGDLLHFCIGDVSGKGMPAALVMTELCSLYRYIISHHTEPQTIVSQINNAMMERSDDTMFCTLFVGVLNLKTGLLSFCNAGHNPPILIRKADSEAKYLTVKPNMPINAFLNYPYLSETIQLNAGDRLFMYTDGVTEAKNGNNQFFGTKATLKSVQSHFNKSLDDFTDTILNDLNLFTQKTEQNDDITMLCLVFNDVNNCISLHYDNVKTNVVAIVNDILDACEMRGNMRLRLALEEPIQNVADYAYETDGPMDVDVIKNTENNSCEITLIDNGKPFNPLETALPDLSVPIQEREIGGLGIMMTRKIMEDVSYEFVNQQNRLKLKYTVK